MKRVQQTIRSHTPRPASSVHPTHPFAGTETGARAGRTASESRPRRPRRPMRPCGIPLSSPTRRRVQRRRRCRLASAGGESSARGPTPAPGARSATTSCRGGDDHRAAAVVVRGPEPPTAFPLRSLPSLPSLPSTRRSRRRCRCPLPRPHPHPSRCGWHRWRRSSRWTRCPKATALPPPGGPIQSSTAGNKVGMHEKNGGTTRAHSSTLVAHLCAACARHPTPPCALRWRGGETHRPLARRRMLVLFR